MADNVSSSRRSFIMSRVKSKDTKPEILVRKFLYGMGFRYRLHVKKMPGSPDIVLKKYNSVIFINGCFWHGHAECKRSKPPKSNTEWWTNKIQKNINNDKRAIGLLRDEEWKVIIVWECELVKTRINDTFSNLIAQIGLI